MSEESPCATGGNRDSSVTRMWGAEGGSIDPWGVPGAPSGGSIPNGGGTGSPSGNSGMSIDPNC